MQDLTSRLLNLTRPRLLARAARIGADDYIRARHLKRLLGRSFPDRQAVILMRLLELEAAQEAARTVASPGYSFARHVEVLIALAAESRLFLNAAPSARHKKTAPNGRRCNRPEDRSLRYINASGIEAFFSATKASRASRIAGSICGC